MTQAITLVIPASTSVVYAKDELIYYFTFIDVTIQLHVDYRRVFNWP